MTHTNPFKIRSVSGRYVTNDDVLPVLKSLQKGALRTTGKSVKGESIYSFTIGQGSRKILMWSQMHGNEATTTKALLDYLTYLQTDPEILKECTILAFPILNPDGARLYTRENAAGIDLNRDFSDLSQPESRLLMEAFRTFEPDYCFNLHDQRTLYGVGDTGKSATVSFLAPANDESRSVNDVRLRAMNVINAMNRELQHVIPGQVGRFDDSFNLNCAGDTFQSFGVPTILFEAGHAAGDYQREVTREYIFKAMGTAVNCVAANVIVGEILDEYLNIPQNKMCFYDFVYRNVKINYDNNDLITTFASQYTEELNEGTIRFCAYLTDAGLDEHTFGHLEYDANGAGFHDGTGSTPRPGSKADFSIGGQRFVNGSPVTD